jgi:hypothetical protein
VTAVDRSARETLKQFLNSSEIKSIISYKMQHGLVMPTKRIFVLMPEYPDLKTVSVGPQQVMQKPRREAGAQSSVSYFLYCDVLPPSGVFTEGPFLLPLEPFTPAAVSDDDVPISPVLAPLPDESDFVEGPFLLPGAPLMPTELSEGVRACFPVFTPGSAFGA